MENSNIPTNFRMLAVPPISPRSMGSKLVIGIKKYKNEVMVKLKKKIKTQKNNNFACVFLTFRK